MGITVRMPAIILVWMNILVWMKMFIQTTITVGIFSSLFIFVASRGHLCDSTAFLLLFWWLLRRSPRAVDSVAPPGERNEDRSTKKHRQKTSIKRDIKCSTRDDRPTMRNMIAKDRHSAPLPTDSSRQSSANSSINNLSHGKCRLFSRSYCYTVWSAIGVILLSVCPSVFCLWRCTFSLSGLVYRAKSCSNVFLAGMFLFVPSDTFALGCIV